MSEATCPKCGTNQRAKYLDHDEEANEVPCVVWTCKTRQVGNLLVQSKHCAYEERIATLTSQLAAATKRADEAEVVAKRESALADHQAEGVHQFAEKVREQKDEIAALHLQLQELTAALTAAESDRDEAVREVERLKSENEALKNTLFAIEHGL